MFLVLIKTADAYGRLQMLMEDCRCLGLQILRNYSIWSPSGLSIGSTSILIYITLYSGDSRLRSTHLDNLSFASNIASTTTSISNLNISFFFRSHTLWNFLPFDLRNSMIPLQFKIKLAKHYWNMASTDIEQPEDEWSFQFSDVGD